MSVFIGDAKYCEAAVGALQKENRMPVVQTDVNIIPNDASLPRVYL